MLNYDLVLLNFGQIYLQVRGATPFQVVQNTSKVHRSRSIAFVSLNHLLMNDECSLGSRQVHQLAKPHPRRGQEFLRLAVRWLRWLQ